MNRIAKKVLLIGWDGADWKIINKLIDKGKMPAIESVVNKGVMGNLSTLEPPFSPMLWTTIATGKRPNKHGILGFTEPDPNTIGVRPVYSTSRKVKAIWNILTQNKIKSHVVGWWPSHPAEPINGIMISNFYQKSKGLKKTKLSQGTVHPQSYSELFNELKVHPREITEQHILPFVPNGAKIDQTTDKRISQIAKNIAEVSSIHAATTWILENEDWEFMAVYLDTIDHFSHGFMNFNPPKMKNISDELFEMYKNVIEGAYIFHDMMLERLLKLAGEETTVIIISDHGFHSDHLRPEYIPSEPAGPAMQHRDYGIICMKGENIKKDERIYGASLLNITPTLLTLFGLPFGQDMDGVPLYQIFEKEVKIETIKSWEEVEGESGMHPKGYQENPMQAQEALKQLVELGYIEKPEENKQLASDKAKIENEYNLGRVYVGANDFYKGIEIFQKLFNGNKYEPRFAQRLISCYKNIGDYKNCKIVMEESAKCLTEIFLTNEQIEKIIKEEIPEDAKEAKKDNLRKIKSNKLNKDKDVKNAVLSYGLIEVELNIQEKNNTNTLEILQKLEKQFAGKKSLLVQIANLYLKVKKWNHAISLFNEILKIDNEANEVYLGIAIAKFNLNEFTEAAEYALTSIGLIYHNYNAHYILGLSLYNLKDYINSALAFEVCLRIMPNHGSARNYVIKVYEILNNKEKANYHKTFFDKIIPDKSDEIANKDLNINFSESKSYTENIKTKIEDSIIVVSGLPRSGTSMMMQILENAGLNIYTDKIRTADISNPKGYYEHENVKSLARNKNWIPEAKGKVVKIISHLLMYLPPKFDYKIIFMIRDLTEVVASQQKMLEKEGKISEKTYPVSLEMTYKKNIEKILEWQKNNFNAKFLFVNYNKIFENSNSEILKIKDFLGLSNLNTEKMVEAIDKNLYRTKNQ